MKHLRSNEPPHKDGKKGAKKKWFCRIWYYDRYGQPKSKSKRFTTKAEASKWYIDTQLD